MPEEAIRHLRERFGLQLAEGYGLTEASPVVTSSAGLPIKVGSVGKVLDGIHVRLVDESGDDVLEGDSARSGSRVPMCSRAISMMSSRPRGVDRRRLAAYR
jgi:long-subunit acyl-CoA synthetase (AMP-forming)